MKKNRLLLLLLPFLLFFINFSDINKSGEIPAGNILKEEYVYPSGKPVGIKVLCSGVLVVGFSPVYGPDGTELNPAFSAGIKEGDYIEKVNGAEVKNSQFLSRAVNMSMGSELTLSVKRDEKILEIKLSPTKTVSGNYAAGMWVRDSIAGIGTVTFFTGDKDKYAALGHCVSDIDTGELMKIKDGDLVTSTIYSRKKGEAGKPGELMGIFDNPEYTVGTVEINSDNGLYGRVTSPEIIEGVPVKTAEIDEIHTGPAVILSTVEGRAPEEFEIEITDINKQKNAGNKGIAIKVTDRELIEKTGGIVQGMSGSPILQDGKFVGAVTHVFVDDPTSGYGIFIGNMLAEAEKIK